MNEESFTNQIAALFSRRNDVFCGIGDDAAALDLNLPGNRLLLAAADQVIESVHYLPGTPAAAVAKKLLNRNLSDIAAMGGIPTHALVTLAANPLSETFLKEFHESLERAASANHVSVIGGDVAALPAPGFCASLTILGEAEKSKLCLRSAAKPGDWIYCTGVLGNSFAGEWHLNFQPRLKEAAFLAGRYTRAMMDLSDGLGKDLRRMASDSRLAFRLDVSALPLRAGAALRNALYDGEDYELVFAVSPDAAADLESRWLFPETRLTRIGRFEEGVPGQFLNEPDEAKLKKGYDHFHET